VLLALFLFTCAPADAPCLKSEGIALAAAGNYRAAIQPFERACKANPAEPDACYYWARALYSSDRFEDSLLALAQAHKSATPAWRIATARGQALDALSRTEAEAELKRALSLFPGQPLREPIPLLALTSFLYRQGRPTEALKLLQSAPAHYQSLPTFHYQLGRALANHQQWPAAAEALRKAIALNPNLSDAHGLLSRAYYRLGNNDLGATHSRLATQGSTTSR
jgi:tetratricopeptide (TPR) repeat protein